jgi:hypothetical protein
MQTGEAQSPSQSFSEKEKKEEEEEEEEEEERDQHTLMYWYSSDVQELSRLGGSGLTKRDVYAATLSFKRQLFMSKHKI